jgi:hypothetical protein
MQEEQLPFGRSELDALSLRANEGQSGLRVYRSSGDPGGQREADQKR